MRQDYYGQVRCILHNNPRTRDDDMLLYSVFMAQSGQVGPLETFYEVMNTAKLRKLPSYESITRARRKVQENEPELRGERYTARQNEQMSYINFSRNH